MSSLRFTVPFSKWWRLAAGLFILIIAPQLTFPADFTVTSPGFFYSFAGVAGENPTITVERGKTYTFSINTPGHPFRINSTGVTGNNPTTLGTLTWTVPMAAVNYSYNCTAHSFMNGTFATVPPAAAPAPTVRIVGFSVGTNVVLKSTGTNGWSAIPEFNTNLTTANWAPMTVLSNNFAGGTNETYCGRPPGTNVFIRVRNQRN